MITDRSTVPRSCITGEYSKMKVDLVIPGSTSIRPNGGREDDGDAFHVAFDPATESPVHLVTGAVAMIRGVDVRELDPLFEAVDPEALERIVGTGDPTGVDSVRFTYGGFEVVVESRGHIWLRRIAERNGGAKDRT